MSFNLKLADWSEFPGLFDAVMSAIAYPESFTITPDEPRRDAYPSHLPPPMPSGRPTATVVITLKVDLHAYGNH